MNEKRNVLLAIGVGGAIAGTLDLLQASILFGWNIPLAIAAGLLGPTAFQGGAGTYVLGVLLHFFIAFSAATIYYAVSLRLEFMKEDAPGFWERNGYNMYGDPFREQRYSL